MCLLGEKNVSALSSVAVERYAVTLVHNRLKCSAKTTTKGKLLVVLHSFFKLLVYVLLGAVLVLEVLSLWLLYVLVQLSKHLLNLGGPVLAVR